MECNNILFIFIVFSQLCTLLAILLNFKNTKMKNNPIKIIDNTMEDDHDFMVERINALNDHIKIEKEENQELDKKIRLFKQELYDKIKELEDLKMQLKALQNQLTLYFSNDKKV